jgi:hypothetical protein
VKESVLRISYAPNWEQQEEREKESVVNPVLHEAGAGSMNIRFRGLNCKKKSTL